tara:strand:+ start:12723 stop:13055 length:333 start_codon:yes stop_codon:yes gene_type:complete
MVAHPGDYPWSSFHYNGEGRDNALLTAHHSYLSLGLNGENRCDNYNALIKSQISDKQLNEIRVATNGNFALGNPSFQDEIALALNRRVIAGEAAAVGCCLSKVTSVKKSN